MPIQFAVLRAYAQSTFTKTYELQPHEGLAWEGTPDVHRGVWKEHGAPGKGVLLHGYKLETLPDLRAVAGWLTANTARADLAIGMGRLREGAAIQIDGDWQDVLGRQQVNYEDHASHLLVLDLDTVQGDLLDDPQEKIREAVYSVTEFDGAAFVASWSPSCGIKSGLRCRVFIELDTAITLAQMKVAIDAINKRGGVQFDTSIYGQQAFVAVSAPVLYAETAAGKRALPRPVPAPVAWFCDGDPVTLGFIAAASAAAIPLAQLTALAEAAAQGLGGPSVGDWLATMSPGNVSIPLHKALCREAFSAPEDQQAQKLGAFIARARVRLLEISQVDGDFARRDREHLNVRHLQKAWDDARRRKQTLTPTYRSTPQAAVTQVTAPTQPAAPLTPREELTLKVVAAANDVLAGNPKQWLVTAPPGAGKSYAVREILTPGVLTSRRVLILVPTHALAEQLQADLQAHVRTLTPDGTYYGVDLASAIRHHKGRKPLCTNAKHGAIASRAEQIGISAKKTACATCPDRGTCPWIKQFDDDAAGVIIKVHSAVTNAHAQSEDWHELAIIDESLLGSMIEEPRPDIKLADLHKDTFSVLLRDQREQLGQLLYNSLPVGHHLRGKVKIIHTQDELDIRLGTEELHRKAITNNLVHASDKRFARMLALLEKSEAVSAIYENMRDSLMRGETKGVRVYRDKQGAWVTYRRRLRLPPSILDKGAIHLDGTAKLDTTLAVWKSICSPDGTPFAADFIDVSPAPEHTRVTQVTDSSFAKSALMDRPDEVLDEQIAIAQKTASAVWLDNALGAEGAALRQTSQLAAEVLTTRKVGRKKRADSRIFSVWLVVLDMAHRLRRAHAVQHVSAAEPSNQVLLVAQKEIITELIELGLPPNVKCAHFGALRGLNNFKDVAGAVIVGRPALSNDELELLTEAIFVADIGLGCVDHADVWGKVTVSVKLVDGTDAPVSCDGHPDMRCRAVQALVSQAEVVQGMARVRPYNRTPDNPCDVVYFGQYPSGIPAERICSTADVRPHEAAVAMLAGGLTSNADANRAWHAQLFAAADSKVAGERGAWQTQRWFMQRALMTWWKGRKQGGAGAAPVILANPLPASFDVREPAVYPYIVKREAAEIQSQNESAEYRKTAGSDFEHNWKSETESGSLTQSLTQAESQSVDTSVVRSTDVIIPQYRFWRLMVLGNQHMQRARWRGGGRGPYARPIMVLAESGLTLVDIAARLQVTIKDARELTDAEVERECARMLMGVIEHAVSEAPSLAEFAKGCDPIEFAETWLGWGGLFAR